MQNKTEQLKKDVLDAVSGTQYGLDEAAKIASQLLSSNIKQGKQLSGVQRHSLGKTASGKDSSASKMI